MPDVFVEQVAEQIEFGLVDQDPEIESNLSIVCSVLSPNQQQGYIEPRADIYTLCSFNTWQSIAPVALGGLAQPFGGRNQSILLGLLLTFALNQVNPISRANCSADST